MKEEEIKTGDCVGRQPEKSVCYFFEILSDLNEPVPKRCRLVQVRQNLIFLSLIFTAIAGGVGDFLSHSSSSLLYLLPSVFNYSVIWYRYYRCEVWRETNCASIIPFNSEHSTIHFFSGFAQLNEHISVVCPETVVPCPHKVHGCRVMVRFCPDRRLEIIALSQSKLHRPCLAHDRHLQHTLFLGLLISFKELKEVLLPYKCTSQCLSSIKPHLRPSSK